MMHWAESYLGKPWASGAAGPDAFDCYGLVRAVYAARHGIFLPVLDVEAARPLAAARAMRDYGQYGAWEPVRAPAELDVVQMGHARHPHHVGVWIDADGGRVLHSVCGSGVVIQTPGSLRLHGWNLLTVYRRRGAR